MDRTAALGSEKISLLLVRFSLPAIAGMLVMAGYNVADRIFVGRWVGSDGIAAVAVCFPLMLVMMAFGMLIAFGGNTLMSLRLGQGDRAGAEHVLGNAFTLYLLLAASFTGFGLLFRIPLLKFFGAPETILPLAEQYLVIILLGTLAHEISFGMNMFIRGDGSPRTAMVTMAIGAGLNLLFDPLFILVFDLGIRGAAIATVLAQSVSATWVLVFFLGKRGSVPLRRKNLRLDWPLVVRIAAAGSPPFAMALSSSGIQALLNNRLLHYDGTTAITVLGIIFSVQTLIQMPIAGISQGMQPIIGYNFGAGRASRVRQSLILATLAATAATIVCFALVETLPEFIIRLFNPDDPELVEMGSRALRIFLFMLPLSGVQMVVASYFQAIGRPRQSMLLTLFRQILALLPLVLILPWIFGLDGIWLAAPAADLMAAILAAWYLRRELRELKRQKHLGERLKAMPSVPATGFQWEETANCSNSRVKSALASLCSLPQPSVGAHPAPRQRALPFKSVP